MRDNWLSNRVFKSFDDIVDHCCDAWNKLIEPAMARSCPSACAIGPIGHDQRSLGIRPLLAQTPVSQALSFRAPCRGFNGLGCCRQALFVAIGAIAASANFAMIKNSTGPRRSRSSEAAPPAPPA